MGIQSGAWDVIVERSGIAEVGPVKVVEQV